MEILFFIIAFSGLFLHERTRTIQLAQWITDTAFIKAGWDEYYWDECEIDWEEYEIPTYQRRGISIKEPTLIEAKVCKAKSVRRASRNKVVRNAA